jgi:GAF domain-containing protein
VLALSNEPQQLIEMVLDKLLHLLKVDYGWVQLVGSEDRNLRLVASRSGTPEMTGVVGLTDSQRILGERVVVGLKVVIPDLSRDGKDGLSSFGLAGFRSLAAVPIRTYHTQGVIGVASRAKKHLDNEVAELLMTVAGLVGATLNIAELGRIALDRERWRVTEEMSGGESIHAKGDLEKRAGSVTRDSGVDRDGVFGHHAKSMDVFRKNHRRG